MTRLGFYLPSIGKNRSFEKHRRVRTSCIVRFSFFFEIFTIDVRIIAAEFVIRSPINQKGEIDFPPNRKRNSGKSSIIPFNSERIHVALIFQRTIRSRRKMFVERNVFFHLVSSLWSILGDLNIRKINRTVETCFREIQRF